MTTPTSTPMSTQRFTGLADLADDAEVESGLLLSRKRLAAYLEQNALVNGFLVHPYHLKHY